MTAAEIRQDLERSRQELLDLSNRNRLISCARTSRGGLEIVDERTEQVFDLLYRQGRPMSFLPPSNGESESGGQLDFGQPEELDPNRRSDNRLQTTLSDEALQRRLLRLFRDSRTLIEEQGINTLYLALGFLYWKESPTADRERRAPLLLLPVELNRSSVRERVTVQYSDEDLGPNLSIEQKFKNDFGIKLPSFPDSNALEPERYFRAIRQAVRDQREWRVEPDEIQLGFFSFTKLRMFRDLDPQQWPEGKTPADHPILSGLIKGELPQPDGAAVPSDRLDEAVQAEDLVTIHDADGSQTEALLRARRAKVMVIQGPPGTGKSQTITNLIADTVMREKKVLFVAEKLAALNVVKRRLNEAGLGEACLELHSRAAKKKQVLEDLRRTCEQGRPNLREGRKEKLQELEFARRRLTEYAHAVNENIGESGIPPRVAYVRYHAAKDRLAGVPVLKLPGAETWTASQYTTFSQLATDLDARRRQSGPPKRNAFWGSRRMGWLPGDREPLYDALEAARKAVGRARDASGALAQALDLPEPVGDVESKLLLAGLAALEAAPAMSDCRRDSTAWSSGPERCDCILDLGDKLSAVRREFGERLIPEAWGRDVLSLRGEALSLGRAWYRFLSGRWRRARAEIAALGAAPPRDVDEMVAWCDAILAEARLRAELDSLRAEYEHFFEPAKDWLSVDWPLRQAQAHWASDSRRRIGERELPEWTFTADPGAARELRNAREEVQAALDDLSDALATVREQLQLDPERLDLNKQSFDPLSARFQDMSEGFGMLQPLTAFNRKAEESRQAELGALGDFADEYSDELDIVKLLERTRCDALIRKAWAERPALKDFDREGHETTAARFRELDRLKLEIDRERAALAHVEQIPRGSGGRMGVLRSQMAKSKAHMAIRKLLIETGPVVQKIKPVFLMSPLSVAQFLEPGALDFDLVVFDEASQVKVVDGFGAVARGERLVVVGDSKQLPPTDFFESIQREQEEDHAAADIPSLLERVESRLSEAGRPMLRWHYRSLHESLIAFSNQRFYDNRLVVFPSSVTDPDRLGLSLRHIPSSVYRRGERRANNPIEARHVAEAVMDHARRQLEKPETERESLMVATFSAAQRDAVDDEIEIARRQDPSYEEFFADARREPFEVKNLESVQGDERDVVFISIGYGKDKDGRLTNNFGPVNSDGGDRRLNVLCSRAKKRCVVFTNCLSSGIANSENPGVNALRAFLYFAETGDFDVTAVGKGDPENDFERSVQTELVRRGFTVDAQVGCAGYRIDLAARDPSRPGCYLLGIECDGAAYHSAKSARDRDRLRQEVLERRGWRIHRIWSTSWFHDREKEIGRAIVAIEQARNDRPGPRTPPDPASPMRTGLPVEESDQASGAPYRVASFRARLGGSQLHDVDPSKLASWLEEVVRVEAPVHFEVATRRVATATGTLRRGSRIVEAFRSACRLAVRQGRLVMKGDILTISGSNLAQVRDRSQLDPSDRKIEYVPPEEIDLGIKQVAEASHGIVEDEIPQAVARLLGLGRTGDNARTIVKNRVRRLKGRDLLTRRGDYYEWDNTVP